MAFIKIITWCCALVLAVIGGAASEENAVNIELNGPTEFIYCDSPQNPDEIELCKKCPARSAPTACQEDMVMIDGEHYKVINDKYSSWDDAHDLCLEVDLVIADPNTQEKGKALADYINDNFGYTYFWWGKSSESLWEVSSPRVGNHYHLLCQCP